MKISIRDKRKSSFSRRKARVEEVALKNLSIALFRAAAPELDERRKAIRCHCHQEHDAQVREVIPCRIHKALKIFYR